MSLMKISDGLHRLKIRFNVTENIERFVYLYLIIGKKVHIIDTGVAGAEVYIANTLEGLGRDIKDVSSILLTHSHPDHIGSAQTLKELSSCYVYACEEEKPWIENIDVQYEERPIPNFYKLVNKSTQVEVIINDGDILPLEKGISLKVLDTKGHSQGSLSFYWVEERIMFTGDSIPVIGEIPIFISVNDSIDSLKKLLLIPDVNYYLSAWDNIFEKEHGITNIRKSLEHLISIDKTIRTVLSENSGLNKEGIYKKVCLSLNLSHLIDNPLFRQSVYASINNCRKWRQHDN